MSKLHVLGGSGDEFLVVVHGPTPAGNNSAGFAWSTLLVNAKRNTTIMTTGSGPGQITTAEANSIAGGTVIEGVFGFTDDPTMPAADRNALLDLIATQTLALHQSRLSQELKWWGAVRP